MKFIKRDDTHWMKSMMQSLFAYQRLSKDNSYLKGYKETLGIERFNHVYDTYSEFLNKNFEVKIGVGSDSEGIIYNSICRKV